MKFINSLIEIIFFVQFDVLQYCYCNGIILCKDNFPKKNILFVKKLVSTKICDLKFLGHHLVNQQQHNSMQNNSGSSLPNPQQLQERHQQVVSNQQSSEGVNNVRMDNNPKKRMLSQQQQQQQHSMVKTNELNT